MTNMAFYTPVKPMDAVQSAESRLNGVGLCISGEPPVQPTFENGFQGMPKLPEDPTLLSEQDVMRLFFTFTEWASYAESCLWVAQCDEGALELFFSRAKAEALRNVEGAKTVTAAKNAAAAVPGVIQAQDNLYAQTCLRTALETVYERCLRYAAAMSRELSRRGSRATTDRRSSKWST